MAPLKQWKTKLTSLLGRTAAKIDVLPVREALPAGARVLEPGASGRRA